MAVFITNKDGATLRERLSKIAEDCKRFRFLVGFFYFSGWKELYDALRIKENNDDDNNKEKDDNRLEDITLEILVGLNVGKIAGRLIEYGYELPNMSREEYFNCFLNSLRTAFSSPETDNKEVHEQIKFFIRLLKEGKIEIRKTKKPNHAKLYIFEYNDKIQKEENSKGCIIIGSSNFTRAGLSEQEEANVEINSDSDFENMNEYFYELWKQSVKITEEPEWKQIIIDIFDGGEVHPTPIKPYEAYAYILKTYIDLYERKKILPFTERILEENGFKKYQYQIDAVNQALNIIEAYGGVIIADVVGLGKSIIASLIACQLGKRGLILCPPGLIGDKNESTGWYEYRNKFHLYNWDIESIGNIDKIAESMAEDNHGYEVVVVDEAHRFRNQDSETYESLMNICRGKIVILLTATPFNNNPSDIFSLLKLFIVPGRSGISIESDLAGRFHAYNYRFKNLSFILKYYDSDEIEKQEKAERLYKRMFSKEPPIDISRVKNELKRMAKEIKAIISPIIIRRNRLDLQEDPEYKEEVSNLSEVKDPQEIFYELTQEQSEFYDDIISYFNEAGKFTGAIYRPYEYEAGLQEETRLDIEENKIYQQQRNLFDFMRRLLVKRFESSFGAFACSIDNFLKTHINVKSFIETSGKYILDRKVIDSIYKGDESDENSVLEEIEKALEEFQKADKSRHSSKHTKIYEIKKFKEREKFLKDIENDIKLFEKIKRRINELNLVKQDPKREEVLKRVKKIISRKGKTKRKVIIFTEYADTVKHLKDYFSKNIGRVLFCEGHLSNKLTALLNVNFNAQYERRKQKDDYDILITTDKLSEGVNLNRAGAIINYDIPWNPTRVIQRVGRINRIGTKVFDFLELYNIFPTEQGADEVKIKEIAGQKMLLIHNALGEDARILDPDEEPTASGLFKKINSNLKETDEDDLNITTRIRKEFREIKQKHSKIIKRIEKFSNRLKTAKKFDEENIVVFRKKGMAIFSLLYKDNLISEKTFEELIEYVKCDYDEKKLELSDKFWDVYKNKMEKYTPKYKVGSVDIATEQRARNSLKSLLKRKDVFEISDIISFVNTLIKDIEEYKTLPTNTLRKLVLPTKTSDKDYKNLIENIRELKRRIGEDYLDVILKRCEGLEEEIIVSIENQCCFEEK